VDDKGRHEVDDNMIGGMMHGMNMRGVIISSVDWDGTTSGE